MARFRAPSTSSLGTSHMTANDDIRKAASRLHRRTSSKTYRIRPAQARPSDADLVASKARRQRIFEQVLPTGSYSFVFVGNLSEKTTVAALRELFSVCGTVLNVVIRQSFFASKVPKGMGTSYATVHFKEPTASDKALYMSGQHLDGCELAVSREIWGIPDGHRILAKHREERMSPKRLIRRVPTLQVEEMKRLESGSSLPGETPTRDAKLSTVVEED